MQVKNLIKILLTLIFVGLYFVNCVIAISSIDSNVRDELKLEPRIRVSIVFENIKLPNSIESVFKFLIT